jgi:hypothetical protein
MAVCEELHCVSDCQYRYDLFFPRTAMTADAMITARMWIESCINSFQVLVVLERKRTSMSSVHKASTCFSFKASGRRGAS